jgi:hypothetical protein
MVTVGRDTMVRVIPQIEVLKMIERVVEKQTVAISLNETVGASYLRPEKGLRLAELILPILQQNLKVQVSLAGVMILRPVFIQRLYIHLYEHLPVDLVSHNLTFTDLKPGDHLVIADAIANAKFYVFDRAGYEECQKDWLDYMVRHGYMSEEAAYGIDDRGDLIEEAF